LPPAIPARKNQAVAAVTVYSGRLRRQAKGRKYRAAVSKDGCGHTAIFPVIIACDVYNRAGDNRKENQGMFH
jgi:hypothetical protein